MAKNKEFTLDSGIKQVYKVEVNGEYKLVVIPVRGFCVANNLKVVKDDITSAIMSAIKAQYGDNAKISYLTSIDSVEVF